MAVRGVGGLKGNVDAVGFIDCGLPLSLLRCSLLGFVVVTWAS